MDGKARGRGAALLRGAARTRAATGVARYLEVAELVGELLPGALVVLVVLPRLVVDVHEGALDLVERLDLPLQLHADVVGPPQRRGLRQHHLHLHEELGPEVVRPDDVAEQRAVVVLRHDADRLEELGLRGLAHDHLHLLAARVHPAVDDVERDDDGAGGVDPPEVAPLVQAREHGGRERDGVAEHVVEVVLRDGGDGVALGLDGDADAPDEEHGLDSDGGADDGVGGERHVGRRRLALGAPQRVRVDGLHGLAQHLERGHAHERRADDDADGLEAPAACGELRVDALAAEPVGPEDDHLGEQVQEAVHHGREDGERPRHDRREDLEREQQHVRADAHVDGAVRRAPRARLPREALDGQVPEAVRVAEGVAVERRLHERRRAPVERTLHKQRRRLAGGLPVPLPA
eukprot:CAMPEP_0118875112 /NCGR_PEP_ID=MMETSP1163-20130328/16297_1 /TAXON_ID=124430 /ORGANISM="Phaeomonas parva, Strain CCMP2877" /LENGTH=404 /DNA_ID=CAMNT_0006810571 /DNA_START=320 /DNA_END=1531 /DNA_ORIENTATION=+